MNFDKTKLLLIALSLFIATNNLLCMEERKSGWGMIGKVLLGWVSPSVLWTQSTQESSPFAHLPEDMTNYIISLVTTGTTGETLEESASAINSLAQVNKELNALINNMQFSCKLVKHLAQRFNCSEETVCSALSTKAAKTYYYTNYQLIEKTKSSFPTQIPNYFSCTLPMDVNFRLNSLGTYAMPAAALGNPTNYPVFLPILPGGGNLIMFLYGVSVVNIKAIDPIIARNCPIDINLSNNNGTTALMLAAKYISLGYQNHHVPHLLSHFPNVAINQQDNNGDTALLHALKTVEIVQGESGNWLSRKVPIILKFFPNFNTIKTLLEHGADPELPNFAGITPLQATHGFKYNDIDAIIQLIKDAIAVKQGQLSSSSSQD